MFLGITSLRSSGSSCMRRQRLRSAMATARLAACWPTIWRSSSCTISRGVMVEELFGVIWGSVIRYSGFGIRDSGFVTEEAVPAGSRWSGSKERFALYESPIPNHASRLLNPGFSSQLFDHDVAVRVDADVAGDADRFGGDGAGGQLRMCQQGACRRQGVPAVG